MKDVAKTSRDNKTQINATNKWLVFLVFIMFIILAGGSTKNPDTGIYQIYYDMSFYSKDKGFGILMQICKKFGITLEYFRLLISLIGMSSIYIIVKKHLTYQYILLFYSMYFICPLFMDITQIRNFLGESLLLVAFHLLYEQKKFYKIRYVVLLLIAASIQQVFWVYIPFVFLGKIEKRKLLKALLSITVFITIFFLSNKTLAVQLAIYLNNVMNDRVTDISYYLTQSNGMGGYIYWLATFINIYILGICRKVEIKYLKTDDKLSELVLWFNIYSIIFLPLTLITIDFFRIQRNLLIINFIVYAKTIMNINQLTVPCIAEKKKIVVALITLLIYIFYWVFLRDGNVETIILPILHNNWILGLG